MKKAVKKFMSLVLVATLITMTGCGGKTSNEDNSSKTPAADSQQEKTEDTEQEVQGTEQEQTVIRYMTWEDSDWQKLTTKFIAEFEAENPDIKISYEPVAGDSYKAKLSAEFASGTGPDVCWVDDWTTTFEMGAYMPLDELIEKHGLDLSTTNQELLNMCTYDNQLYGLGGWLNSGMINYNKELFDEAGIPYPESGWTWEECYEAAEKLTTGSGGDKVYGIYMQNWSAFIENMFWNGGGTVIDENNNYHTINSSENAGALEYFTSFEMNGLSPDQSTVEANGGLIDMFNNGKIAMIYFFPNVVVSARTTGSFDLDKLGIVPVPVKEKGQLPSANILFTNPICITATCKEPDAAFRFLSALVSKEHQTEFCENGYGLPAETSIVNELGMDTDPHMSVFIDPVIAPEKYAEVRTYLAYSPVAGIISTELQNAVSRVIESGQSPQEALDEAVANIESQELMQ